MAHPGLFQALHQRLVHPPLGVHREHVGHRDAQQDQVLAVGAAEVGREDELAVVVRPEHLEQVVGGHVEALDQAGVDRL